LPGELLPTPSALAAAAFLSLLGWACVTDATRYIIPNRVCLALLVLWPVAAVSGAVPVPWWSSVGAFAAVAVYTGLPWYLGTLPEGRRVGFPGWIAAAMALAAAASGVVLVASILAESCRAVGCPDASPPPLAMDPAMALAAFATLSALAYVALVFWLAGRGRMPYGGGDFKLSTAIAPWLGLGGAFEFVVLTALAGGGLAGVYLTLRAAFARPPCPWVAAVWHPEGHIPYGLAICAAAAAVFLGWGPF